MIQRNKLSEKDLSIAIQKGEFSDDIIKRCEKVAIVLTQSWCPQWLFMRGWFGTFGKSRDLPDICVFEAEYDKLPVFSEFREFKENSFNNWEVPYVRYYREGRLTGESNFVSSASFMDFFK